jgi:hypothetical protein
MRLSGFVCVLVFAGAACNISVARSEDCKCSGAPIGTPYSGGDGQPPITAVLAFVASFLTYGLAKPPTVAAGTPTPPASGVSVSLAVIGFVVAVLALIALIFIAQRLMAIDPGLESFLIRIAYILLFVGMGPPLGWGLGRTIG